MHMSIIFLLALGFNLLPQFITGIPLKYHLLRDASSFVNISQTVVNPEIFASDTMMPRTLPVGLLFFLRWSTQLGVFLGVELIQWSIYLSFISLFIFLFGVYAVTAYTLENKAFSFLITLISIIPVKCLGAFNFGFQTLGFVPKNLFLALSIITLFFYFYGVKHEKAGWIGLFFLLTGILINFYPAFPVHTAATFLLAEWFRKGRFDFRILCYSALVCLGSLPALTDVMINFVHTKVDNDLLKLASTYTMMIPLSWRTVYYFRTFVTYAVIIPILYFKIIRYCNPKIQDQLRPWLAIVMGSFLISIGGVLLELKFPSLWRFLIPRASVWYIFAAMMVLVVGVDCYFRQERRRQSFLPIVISLVILLWQSNIGYVGFRLYKAYQSKHDKKALLLALDHLKRKSDLEDVILAPCGRAEDLALEVRAYSQRPVYVTHTDGGIAIFSGSNGRLWWERYQKIRNLFPITNLMTFIEFMRREKIDYAIFPAETLKDTNRDYLNYIIYNNRYLIAKAKL